ncbi:MAG: mechanosensitive ion channel family protein [Proteobacteria bacterium]|nr:mechanosensitive ion channel family protein [Pseudomonadota bacterium]
MLALLTNLSGKADFQDSLQSVQDTVAVASDSTGTVAGAGEEMGRAVDLLASGDIYSFSQQMKVIFINFVDNVLPEFITAFLVFVLLYGVYRVVRALLARVLKASRHVDAGLESLLLKSASIVAWAFISVMVLAQFGIDVSALLAGLSIVGLALGFAAKDSLENFISGVTIMIDRPFRVGDQVVVQDTYGTVQDITLRSTRLRTLNNEVMVMPNVLMINQKLVNHTLMGLLRIEVPFSIAYKESTDAARSVVLELLNADSRIAADFPVEVVVVELGSSSVDMVLRFHVRNSAIEVPIKAEYTEKIFKALKAAKIEIPFPHLQLFIDEAKGLSPNAGQSGATPPAPDWKPLK